MIKPVIPVEVPDAEQRLNDYAEKNLWDHLVQSLIAQQKEPVVVVTIANGVISERRKFFDTTPPVPTSPSQENNPTMEETLGALRQQSYCK